MEGTITSVENCGSIVVVWLELEDGTNKPIYMERRAFFWMVEGEGIKVVSELVDRPVEFDGEALLFLDNLEAA